jgi:hypothetical protein
MSALSWLILIILGGVFVFGVIYMILDAVRIVTAVTLLVMDCWKWLVSKWSVKMKPIEFKEQTAVHPQDPLEYLYMPMHRTKDGEFTSCWQLSLRERFKLLFTGKLWLTQVTFNATLQPVRLSIEKPL